MTRTAPLPRERRRSRRDLPSFSAIFRDLRTQLTRLVRDELALLKAELFQKLARMGVGIGMFVVAALLGFFALAVLITTAVLAVALVLPAWLAALIIGVALIVLAGVLVLVGVRSLKRAMPPIPGETIESVREDFRALKEDHR
jgi:hypothetical protein